MRIEVGEKKREKSRSGESQYVGSPLLFRFVLFFINNQFHQGNGFVFPIRREKSFSHFKRKEFSTMKSLYGTMFLLIQGHKRIQETKRVLNGRGNGLFR